MQRVLVFGASGHGKVVAFVARAAGIEVVGFVDDDPAKGRSGFCGLPVWTWQEAMGRCGGHGLPGIGLGVGDNAARQRCADRVRAEGLEPLTLVHPSAVLAPGATLGPGSVVMPLVAVNPDAVVGAGAILNTGCVVEHDCVLGDFVHLSPNAALGGGVRIGDRTHLGLGAVVLPLVTVGADVRVGAGAVVNRSVADGATVVGAPARPVDRGSR